MGAGMVQHVRAYCSALKWHRLKPVPGGWSGVRIQVSRRNPRAVTGAPWLGCGWGVETRPPRVPRAAAVAPCGECSGRSLLAPLGDTGWGWVRTGK